MEVHIFRPADVGKVNNFTYRFGNTMVKAARLRTATEESKRLNRVEEPVISKKLQAAIFLINNTN